MIDEFIHKMSDFKLIVIVGYLPPEHSKWGRDGDNFFNHILCEIYQMEDVDMLVFAGDVNARIGMKKDDIDDVDEIANRICIDENNLHIRL